MAFGTITCYTVLAAIFCSVTGVPTVGPIPRSQLLGASIQDGTFSLSAEKRPSSETFVNGIKRLSPEDVAAAGNRNRSSIALNKRQGLASSIGVGSNWYIPLSIGTPPQNFYVLGDSGSPSTSFQSDLLPASVRGDTPLYKPDQSSTAKQKQGYTYSECFGSGYCDNGDVYTDRFQVGYSVLTDFAFLVETNANQVSNGPRTGTLGLNHDVNGQTSSPDRIPTWFASVKSSLKSPVWTVNFIRSQNSGTFHFGYIDDSQYTGSIAYSNIIDFSGEWSVQITGYQIGNNAFVNQNFNTVIDTGTGGSDLPRSVVDAYFAKIPGSSFNSGYNTYQYPCDQQLLDFTFGLPDGGKTTIPAAYLENGSIDGDNCVSQLNVGSDDGSLWGMTFIEALFVVFDYDGNRVGFANKPSSDA